MNLSSDALQSRCMSGGSAVASPRRAGTVAESRRSVLKSMPLTSPPASTSATDSLPGAERTDLADALGMPAAWSSDTLAGPWGVPTSEPAR